MFLIYQGQTSPSITGQVTIDGSPIDVTVLGTSLTFRMRPAGSATVVVSGAAVATGVSGTSSQGDWRYDWQAADTASPREGSFESWLEVTLPASTPMSTPEVEVGIVTHAPTLAAPLTLCEEWVTGAQVAERCPGALNVIEAAQMASEALYELSARQFAGVCDAVVRPCQLGCACVLWEGGCRGCGCGISSEVKLVGQAINVLEVKVDGAIVPPAEYRVDDRVWLVALGTRVWPSCQDLTRPTSAVNTFEVTYEHGRHPPELGRTAALELACQLAAAMSGGECSLPAGVTQVVRQGVTYQRQQLAAALKTGGGSGLAIVDLFLATYNPNGLRRRPAVASPDRRYPRRTTA